MSLCSTEDTYTDKPSISSSAGVIKVMLHQQLRTIKATGKELVLGKSSIKSSPVHAVYSVHSKGDWWGGEEVIPGHGKGKSISCSAYIPPPT